MKKKPFIFLSMPITPRSTTENHAVEYLNNIRIGFGYAAMFIKAGFAVYCPAADFPYFLSALAFPSVEDIYEQDLTILGHTDAVFTVPGWERSENCKREIDQAKLLGKLVFNDMDTMKEWKDANF